MYDKFVSPFSTRYSSDEMQYLFSQNKKFSTWRRLWIALARAEKTLGLDITDEQIAQLEAFKDDINYSQAEAREREVRHDVMAHVHAYGLQCPKAAGIIHLGATSCYVTDNTDIIIMREALLLISAKLLGVISLLRGFADEYKSLPALAYTHLQPAQLTTVGKRATLWIQELYMDFEDAQARLLALALLGSKGTTGTQASFMELFEGDESKIDLLDELIAKEMGFEGVVPVSGQTYSRKVDTQVMNVLCGIAQTCSKFSYDLRILQSFKEMEEPFEKSQIGSSAMPYKRNPMRSERITALARYVISNSLNPAITAATQWFERTLDDSANRRIALSEAFLATDAILNLMLSVSSGLVVYPKVIEQRVMSELPFMATENIMMRAVKNGGDRQQLHERLREHAMAAAGVVKEQGGKNDLVDRIASDPAFMLDKGELSGILNPSNFTGRSAAQVSRYLREYIDPLLKRHEERKIQAAELKV